MNLNSLLPPECLRHILSFLPLRDLLRLHEVCDLWASHQRSLCANRRQVTICIGEDAISRIYNSSFPMPYEEVLDPSTPADREPRLEYDARKAEDNLNVLQFDWLNSVTCDKLVSLLTNVIELKVVVDEVPSVMVIGEINWERKSVLMNKIIKMLTRWRSTLEAFTLSIWRIDYKQRQIHQDHWRLFHAINQLDSLRRLTIKLGDYDNVNMAPSIPHIEPFQFSVLSHLEQFSFLNSKHYLRLLLPSLIKHGGPESTLKRISLGNVHAGDIWRDDKSGHWMQNVVHFPDHRISRFNRNVLLTLDKFPRLECISIEVDSLDKIPQMLKYLESLRHLTYLEMDLKNCNSEYSMNDEMNGDEWDEIDRPPAPIGDPCLPSVRVLMINALCQTHNDLHPFLWSSILPNLEILHYDNTSGYCRICSIEIRRQCATMIGNQEPDPDRSQQSLCASIRRGCTKELLSPWTLCPRIGRIYSGDPFIPQRWNLSELREAVARREHLKRKKGIEMRLRSRKLKKNN